MNNVDVLGLASTNFGSYGNFGGLNWTVLDSNGNVVGHDNDPSDTHVYLDDCGGWDGTKAGLSSLTQIGWEISGYSDYRRGHPCFYIGQNTRANWVNGELVVNGGYSLMRGNYAVLNLSGTLNTVSVTGECWRYNFVDRLGDGTDIMQVLALGLRNSSLLKAATFTKPFVNVLRLGMAIEKDNYVVGYNTQVTSSKIVVEMVAGATGIYIGQEIGGYIGGGIGLLCGGFNAIPGVVIGKAVGGAIGGYFTSSYASDLIK